MTIGDEFREFATEMVAEFGSRVFWKRDTLTSSPSTGTVTVTATVTHTMTVALAGASVRRQLPDEVASSAEHVLVVDAASLPFAVVAPALAPEVSFDDRVWWEAGRVYRVARIQEFLGPGGAAAPIPVAYIVALVA